MGFLCWFVISLRSTLCMMSNFGGKVDYVLFIIHCLIGPLAALLEPAKRLTDYSVFVFPRVIEGFYDLFEKILKHIRDLKIIPRHVMTL